MDSTSMGCLKFPTASHCRTSPPMKTKNLSNLLVSAFIPSQGANVHAHSSVRYQSQMLRSLSEVGSVDSVVGFYQSAKLGAFFKQSLVEAQAIHQEKLRHGGIVIVHGMKLDGYFDKRDDRLTSNPDTTATSQGNASFRAFRLTKPFVDAYRRHNFSTARYRISSSEMWQWRIY